MDDAAYSALIDLKQSIDKHRSVQEDAIDTMKALIGTLRETAQQMADLQESLAKR